MFRILLIFIILSITGYITIWLKNDPGSIAIEWQGWLIQTSVPIILTITLILLLSLIIFYLILKKIFFLPKTIRVNYKQKKTDKAEKNIIKAFSAKSMGELELAETLSKDAKYLNGTPLKLVLDTEINNHYGNEEAYIKDLKKMLDHPETLLLSVKSLTNFYFNKGNLKDAIKIIKMSPKSKNTPKWFFFTTLKLNILEKNWDEMINNIKSLSRYTKTNNSEIKHIKSRVYFFKALEHNKEKNSVRLKDINISLKFDPSFAPAITFKAKLLYKKDKTLGLNYIKKSWKKYPHPDIANYIFEIYKDKPKNVLLNITKQLTKLNNNTFLNSYTMAKVALLTESWSLVRQSLKIIPEKEWTKGIYIMMADLEKKEHGNISKSNQWIEKAKNANLDYTWGCTSCTYIQSSWSLICPKCSNLNSITWQQYSLSKIYTNKISTAKIDTLSFEDNNSKGIISELNSGIDR
jgi:HemY protein